MRVLISTGEVSGDLQGSLLVKALFHEANARSCELEVLALGGSRMEEAGAKIIANTSTMGAIGLIEALPFVLPTFKLQRKVNKILTNLSIDVLVLIDYMGPNIKLGNKVRNMNKNIPIIYYIAPQEWAWRLGDSGTTNLIKFTDKILAIFRAEADFYQARGGTVTWVGHPMLDSIPKLPTKEESYRKLNLDEKKKILLLFPASRPQEMRYLLPVLIKTAYLLQKKHPSIYVIIPSSLEIFDEKLKEALKISGIEGRVIPASDGDEIKPYLFAISDLALSKSGTINMELALGGVPQIVGYKLSKLTAFIASKILRFNVKHISPVNLLLNERVVPELLQDSFNEEELFKMALLIFEDKERRAFILEGYERLRIHLGSPGVVKRAAKQIFDTASK